MNDQHIPEHWDEFLYGQCLRRLLHMLHILRLAYPDKRIYICKYDLDAAYRRLHMHPDHAVRASTIVDKIGYLLLCLPFEALTGPSAYSLVSEAISDLANDLIRDPHWDPSKLQSPNSTHLHNPISFDDSIPFSKEKPLLVYLLLCTALCDGYINDLIAMTVDIADAVDRSQQPPLLASHCIFRPLHQHDNPNRNDTQSLLRNFLDEGRPEEEKTILGRHVPTREFNIKLSEDKYKRWIIDIDKLLQTDYKPKQKQIQSMVVCLNHADYILPHARYFINRLRHLLYRSQKTFSTKKPRSSQKINTLKTT